MNKLAPFAVVVAAVAILIGAGGKSDKTEMTLRANPAMAFAPVRITLTAQVKGGPDANPDLYCPSVEWDWGDGTVSESSSDCDPFQPNKSAIRRSYVTQHVYKFGGDYVVQLRLKKQNKLVAVASTSLNIGSALSEGGDSIR